MSQKYGTKCAKTTACGPDAKGSRPSFTPTARAIAIVAACVAVESAAHTATNVPYFALPRCRSKTRKWYNRYNPNVASPGEVNARWCVASRHSCPPVHTPLSAFRPTRCLASVTCVRRVATVTPHASSLAAGALTDDRSVETDADDRWGGGRMGENDGWVSGGIVVCSPTPEKDDELFWGNAEDPTRRSEAFREKERRPVRPPSSSFFFFFFFFRRRPPGRSLDAEEARRRRRRRRAKRLQRPGRPSEPPRKCRPLGAPFPSVGNEQTTQRPPEQKPNARDE